MAPSSGNFGSTATLVALAMGAAKVIAMGRSADKLKRVLEGAGDRVAMVTMSGDVETETRALLEHGPADVYFDMFSQSAVLAGLFNTKEIISAA
ncbi:hypothetical protein J3459_010548 [Metarhizium acridum]|uniref:uncharacterized protein n=1 Tax=Metarhizium acridum TaxID=92637 RepID=UPI001C6B1987|nr:hypothetical protein J3458_020791 [Metarhizium acridum]KAG8422254.1 hypothetical protein J3459_010548 [Metarhizium acridum]